MNDFEKFGSSLIQGESKGAKVHVFDLNQNIIQNMSPLSYKLGEQWMTLRSLVPVQFKEKVKVQKYIWLASKYYPKYISIVLAWWTVNDFEKFGSSLVKVQKYIWLESKYYPIYVRVVLAWWTVNDFEKFGYRFTWAKL